MVDAATLQAFVSQFNNAYVEILGPAAPDQCVDEANAWCEWLGIELFGGNAADFPQDPRPNMTWLPYPGNLPEPGDLVVWDTRIGPYGHVDTFLNWVNKPVEWDGFDQNWPLGWPCHRQRHNFYGVAGMLRPNLVRRDIDMSHLRLLKGDGTKAAGTEDPRGEGAVYLADFFYLWKRHIYGGNGAALAPDGGNLELELYLGRAREIQPDYELESFNQYALDRIFDLTGRIEDGPGSYPGISQLSYRDDVLAAASHNHPATTTIGPPN